MEGGDPALRAGYVKVGTFPTPFVSGSQKGNSEIEIGVRRRWGVRVGGRCFLFSPTVEAGHQGL